MTEDQKTKLQQASRKATEHFDKFDGNIANGIMKGTALNYFREGALEILENPEKYGLTPAAIGECQECGKTKPLVGDYNGQGYDVCKTCLDSLNSFFDEEYR